MGVNTGEKNRNVCFKPFFLHGCFRAIHLSAPADERVKGPNVCKLRAGGGRELAARRARTLYLFMRLVNLLIACGGDIHRRRRQPCDRGHLALHALTWMDECVFLFEMSSELEKEEKTAHKTHNLRDAAMNI